MSKSYTLILGNGYKVGLDGKGLALGGHRLPAALNSRGNGNIYNPSHTDKLSLSMSQKNFNKLLGGKGCSVSASDRAVCKIHLIRLRETFFFFSG